MKKRSFKIIPDPYDAGEFLFSKKDLTCSPGLTVLVGSNGSGKTTLMNLMKENLEKKKIPVFHYDNYKNGGSQAKERYLFYNDMEALASSFLASEGEQIVISMNRKAGEIGHFVKTTDSEELWILLDGIDSGLSIDNILDLKGLFSLIIENQSHRDVYILVTANSYEMANGERCLDTGNLEEISFKDYEEYREYILKTRETKDERIAESHND